MAGGPETAADELGRTDGLVGRDSGGKAASEHGAAAGNTEEPEDVVKGTARPAGPKPGGYAGAIRRQRLPLRDGR